MEATAVGPNRTGAVPVRREVEKMIDAVKEFSPPVPISTLAMDVERQSYITEADAVGSIPPPPAGVKGKAKAGAAKPGEAISVFMDKLGERLAFERTGTRLYDALITKYLALQNAEGAMGAEGKKSGKRAGNGGNGNGGAVPTGDTGLQTLRKIRADELSHFHLLSDAVASLGGDPTAQTPCADVAAAASIGIMQTITDPRTTFAQCLNSILTAELTDNAGWELLGELATQAGQPQMAETFREALQTEAEHLETVRSWLAGLLSKAAGSPAV
jgi:hypothetical protein